MQQRPAIYPGRTLVPAPAPAATRPAPLAAEKPRQAARTATPPAPHSLLDGVPTAACRKEMRDAASAEGLFVRPRARSSGGNMSRDGELVRFNTQQISQHKTRSQIFSLIVVAERLEQAWVDNKISAEEYDTRCSDLIAKFNAAKRAYPSDIGKFAEEFRVSPKHGYTSGFNRLVVVGLPGTKERHVLTADDQKRQAKFSGACTAGFITLLDAINLGQKTPEDLLPVAQELHNNLGRIEGLQTGFAFRNELEEWTRKMYAMNALTPMSEDSLAKLKLQVDLGYNAFGRHFD
jgi:VPS28 protein